MTTSMGKSELLSPIYSFPEAVPEQFLSTTWFENAAMKIRTDLDRLTDEYLAGKGVKEERESLQIFRYLVITH